MPEQRFRFLIRRATQMAESNEYGTAIAREGATLCIAQVSRGGADNIVDSSSTLIDLSSADKAQKVLRMWYAWLEHDETRELAADRPGRALARIMIAIDALDEGQ